MQPIQDADLLAELEGKKKKPVKGQVSDQSLLDELNGVTTSPEYAPESTLETLGRSGISLVDSAANTLTGALDMAAYPVARAYYGTVGGLSPEEAAARATQETTSPKDVFGRLAGVTGTSGYENAPIRRAGTAIGEAVSPYIDENVIQPAADYTGMPEQDIANMLAMGGALVPGAGRLAGRAAAVPARAVRDVTGGALGRGLNMIADPGQVPKLGQTQSSRIPLGKTYITPEGIAELKTGMPTSEANIRPTTDLQKTLPGRISLGLTGGEVPVTGQAARAFGERLGETYRNPLTAALDIGSAALTGVPLYTAKQALTGLAKGGAEYYLGRKGFSQLSPTQLAALDAGQNPWGSSLASTAPVAGAVAPRAAAAITEPSVTTQPVAPLQLGYEPPKMYVSPEGVVAADVNASARAGLEQKYQAQPVTPAQIADQAQANMPGFKEPQVTAKPVAPNEIPPAAAAVGETAEQVAARQNIIDLINRRRGVVTDNPAATRETFVNRVNETMDQLKQAREENKAQFGERATAMNEQAGQGSKQLGQKDIITEATAVRHMINQTSQSAVRQQGKQVSYNIAAYDDLAQQSATTLDWTTAPDITSMKIGDARQAMNKWMFEQINEQVPELGLKERATQQRTLQKQADEEMGLTGKEEFTPDELAAMDRRMNKLTKPKDAMEMKTTPPTFANKDEFLKQSMMDELKGEPTLGSYIDGDKRIEYTTRSVSGSPFKNIIDKTEYDVKTGKKLKSTNVTLGKPTK